MADDYHRQIEDSRSVARQHTRAGDDPNDRNIRLAPETREGKRKAQINRRRIQARGKSR